MKYKIRVNARNYVTLAQLPRVTKWLIRKPIIVGKVTYIPYTTLVGSISLPELAYFMYRGRQQTTIGYLNWLIKYYTDSKFRVHQECQCVANSIYYQVSIAKKRAALVYEIDRIYNLDTSKQFTRSGISNLIASMSSYRNFTNN